MKKKLLGTAILYSTKSTAYNKKIRESEVSLSCLNVQYFEKVDQLIQLGQLRLPYYSSLTDVNTAWCWFDTELQFFQLMDNINVWMDLLAVHCKSGILMGQCSRKLAGIE